MKTALITGASSGIGKDFSKIFAINGFNLVLVARNKKKLETVAENLKKEYKITAEIIVLDLSDETSAKKLFDEVQKRRIVIDVLINNAGFGKYGTVTESEIQKNNSMIKLNILTLTGLSYFFAKDMLNRNEGRILNVASTAAFQPLPRFAIYAASKAYVLSFTEAMHYELKNTGVHISALCPGATATNFKRNADVKNSKLFKGNVMNSMDVALAGYKGLMQNKMVIIPGFKNKMLAVISKLTPSRKLVAYISNKMS